MILFFRKNIFHFFKIADTAFLAGFKAAIIRCLHIHRFLPLPEQKFAADAAVNLIPRQWFAGVSFARLDAEGSMQWPVTQAAPHGTPTMHVGSFVRGLGQLTETVYVPTTERANRRFPLVLTTGRILSQYNVGAQTRRTANIAWHHEDVLEIHPHDAEDRGITDGDLVAITSRVGETTLRARLSERMQPGVVYTTFHHPLSGANVITTENSDWATNCPEYKVTAVQLRKAAGPSSWQQEHSRFDRQQLHHAHLD